MSIQVESFVNLLQKSRSLYGYCTTEVKAVKETSDLRRFRRQASSKASLLSVGEQQSPTTDIHETLYSLLLSLFPSNSHKYTIACDIGEPVEHHDRRMTILATALKALREKAGFNIPKVRITTAMNIITC